MEIIAVVVGAALGYGAGWLQQRLDRRRLRVRLACAMLLELRRVERNLRDMAESERAAHASVDFPLQAHRDAMSRLDLFKPATVAAIFDLLSNVADIQHGMQLIATGQVQPTDNRAWEQRARAIFAANRVEALRVALGSEGGRIVADRDIAQELVTFPELPQLNRPSFEQPIRRASG